jgi:hypothetical protein
MWSSHSLSIAEWRATAFGESCGCAFADALECPAESSRTTVAASAAAAMVTMFVRRVMLYLLS